MKKLIKWGAGVLIISVATTYPVLSLDPVYTAVSYYLRNKHTTFISYLHPTSPQVIIRGHCPTSHHTRQLPHKSQCEANTTPYHSPTSHNTILQSHNTIPQSDKSQHHHSPTSHNTIPQSHKSQHHTTVPQVTTPDHAQNPAVVSVTTMNIKMFLCRSPKYFISENIYLFL